ncbi:arylsulfotransferase family protein [Streptomyces sp. B6B3]|uniref:arylsulfotransferase family protein n=1 Tax=Streptomyces sp. B6B3 TaxID=3153570 RepID=UPI00325D63A7
MRHLQRNLPLLRCTTAAAAVAAVLCSLAPAASAAERQAAPVGSSAAPTADAPFVTQPTLVAPGLTTTTTGEVSDELILATPGNSGTGGGDLAIYDNSGQLIWTRAATGGGMYYDFEPVTFRGQPALATFQVASFGGTGTRCVILDTSYNEIATLTMQGNYPLDPHDVEFSPDGDRVLLQSYSTATYNLSPYGGPANATIMNPVIQEIDLNTNQVTFQWSAIENIPVTETTESLTGGFGFFDLYHTNSLEYDTDGDILVSARNTSTVYKIDIDTGDIIWRFGGENNDFTFNGGSAAMPSYQHDARRLPDGSLSVFDNGNAHSPATSRGTVYDIDEQAMTATLVEDMRPTSPLFGMYVGNNRLLDNGNFLVSYGNTGQFEEYRDGQRVFTGRFDQGYVTYRTERAEWEATPSVPPDVVVDQSADDGSSSVYVSWNGATEVERWRIEAGPSRGELTELATVDKTGFETAARVAAPDDDTVYRVTALDASGEPLGEPRILTP